MRYLTAVTCVLLASVYQCLANGLPRCITQASTSETIVCRNVDLSLLTAQDISDQLGRSDFQVTSVELINCSVPPSIPFLNTDVFTSLRSLTLDSLSNAPTINISTFSKYVSNLEELRLLNMPSLRSVDFMKDTDIIRVPWSKLKRFRVEGCGVTSIHYEVWEKLFRLESLIIKSNHLRSLDFRSGNQFLVELDASNNDISEIKNFMWDTFTVLQRINLSSNQLSDADILNKIYHTVTSIDLSHNRFTHLTLTMNGNSELDKLILNSNHLVSITPSLAASGRTNLRHLDLSGNKKLALSSVSFKGLVYLEYLDLHSCRLKNITTEFQNLMSLMSLNLSQNALKDLPYNTFKGTEELHHLDLHGNRLNSLMFLSARQAPALMQLTTLDLRSNELRSLPNFTSVYNLKLLSIRDNRLDRLDGCNHMDTLTRLTQLCTPMKTSSLCQVQSFVQILRDNSVSGKMSLNNEECCNNPLHTNPACCLHSTSLPSCQSDTPLVYSKECPNLKELCYPATTPTPRLTGQPVVTEERKGFKELFPSEVAAIVIGYLLAIVMLSVLIWFILRQNRLYNKWTAAQHTEDMLNFISNRESGISYNAMTETLSRSPQRSPFFERTQQRLDSVDSLGSISTGSVTYSEPLPADLKASPIQLGGRKKFDVKKSPKIIPPQLPATNGYTGCRPKISVPTISISDSPPAAAANATESPTSMSVYSYASVQSEHPQPQSDIDAIPWASSARLRSSSMSKLLTSSQMDTLAGSLANQPYRFLNTTKLPRSKVSAGRVQRVRRSSGDPASSAARRRYLRSHRSPLAHQKTLN